MTRLQQLEEVLETISVNIKLYKASAQCFGKNYREHIETIVAKFSGDDVPEAVAENIQLVQNNEEWQRKLELDPFAADFDLLTRYAGVMLYTLAGTAPN